MRLNGFSKVVGLVERRPRGMDGQWYLSYVCRTAMLCWSDDEGVGGVRRRSRRCLTGSDSGENIGVYNDSGCSSKMSIDGYLSAMTMHLWTYVPSPSTTEHFVSLLLPLNQSIHGIAASESTDFYPLAAIQLPVWSFQSCAEIFGPLFLVAENDCGGGECGSNSRG